MKRFCQSILILLFAFALFACSRNEQPKTPLETFKTYTLAIKKKDAAMMKSLLSKNSLEMAQKEAQAQNVSLDEIIQRETLFSGDQTTVEYRNEKITGEKAQIEVKDFSDLWNTVYFVKEDGRWKIAKERFAEEIDKQIEEDNKRYDEIFNRGRQP